MSIRRLAACAAAAIVAVVAVPAQANQESEEADSGTHNLVLTDAEGELTEAASAAEIIVEEADDVPAAEADDIPAAEEEYLYISDTIGTPSFSVAGVTWDEGEMLPEGARVEMRTLDGEAWSEWYVLAVDDPGEGRPGTEPYISGESTGIQVRLVGTGELPAGLTVSVVDGEGPQVELEVGEVAVDPEEGTLTDEVANANEAESILSGSADGTFNDAGVSLEAKPAVSSLAAGSGSMSAMVPTALTSAQSQAAVKLGNIQPRSAWGADERMMTWDPQYVKLEGAIIHHTAGTNSYTRAQVPGVIRGIYSYHSQTRGWGDIGYNVLIDQYGGRWEGRYGTLKAAPGRMVIGGHARPMNTGTIGVSVMGNYTLIEPSSAVLTALSDVIASEFAIAGVNPSTASPLRIPTGATGLLSPGSALPRISGHKDVSATSCPARIYNYFSTIRSETARKYQNILAASAPVTTGPVTFYLNNTWGPYGFAQFAYGSRTDKALVGDWNGDGKDTISLRSGNRYAINDFTVPERVDASFNLIYGAAGDQVYVGDWNGDGIDTLAVRRGNTFYIRNSLTPGNADVVFTYGRTGDVVLVGDWDGDGIDTLAVRRGNAYHLSNRIESGPADEVIYYGKASDEVYIGRFAGLRADSIAVRRSNTYYISNTLRNGAADRVVIYGRTGDETLVGDWDGNLVATFGVRRVTQ